LAATRTVADDRNFDIRVCNWCWKKRKAYLLNHDENGDPVDAPVRQG
jgi:hypothetical protein